ncbi:21870_t:CDS:2, partial [Cetraspora pellucida]
ITRNATSDKNLKSESTLIALMNDSVPYVPLIEYTLELLAVAGSKLSRSYSPIKIITIITPEARAVGDALRKLDAKNNGKTNECVHCETVELYPRKCRMVMDMEVFKKHANVQIRNDLIDCQIDTVPALFTENFDY